jgi:uncharacterized protein (TIGR00369 family)
MTENHSEVEDREVMGRWPGSCFACSNPSGLNLRFVHTKDGAMTRCTIPGTYCGFDGLVHGGIIATLLDETSCWAIFARLGRLGVTREMTTRFIKPVLIGAELAVTARIVSHDPRTAMVHATICDAAGDVLAEAESAWAFPRLGRIASLAGVEEGILQDFLDDCCCR